jgi:hypothetical protein
MSADGDYEWTDEDFVPRDDLGKGEDDPVEQLREYVRRRLKEGATQAEVENELVSGGLDPTFATELVSSVRKTGNYTTLHVGTQTWVGGIPAGFFRNPVFERKLRLARRRQRREREAARSTDAPNPELRFDEPAGRRPRRWPRVGRLVLVAFTSLGLLVGVPLLFVETSFGPAAILGFTLGWLGVGFVAFVATQARGRRLALVAVLTLLALAAVLALLLVAASLLFHRPLW